MLLIKMKSSICKVVLERLGIHHSDGFLSELDEFNPYRQTFFGIATILEHYNLPSEGVRFANKKGLDASDLPAIVFIGGEPVLCLSFFDNGITCVGADGAETTYSLNRFEKEWNGTALLLHPSSDTKEPDYLTNIKERFSIRLKHIGLISTALILIVLGVLFSAMQWGMMWWSALIVNAFGIGLSVLLLQKQLSIPNALTDKLCGLVKESHCDDVTNSSGSTIFGLVKLSEIGMGFFLTNLICLLYFNNVVDALAIIAVCVLPFSFWSVWYQKFVAKSWCVLCLGTLSLMWLQALAYLLGGEYYHLSIRLINLIFVGAMYVAVTLITNWLMYKLKQARESRQWRLRFERLKFHQSVLHALADEAKRYNTGNEVCSSMLFGNPEAQHNITVFSNPYCGPCGELHKKLNDYPGDTVSIRYIMTFFTEKQSVINRYFIAAYRELGPRATWNLLGDWYSGGKKKGEAFFAALPLDIDHPEVLEEFKKQRTWRAQTDLVGTPTAIIDGREVSWPYQVEDYPLLWE